MDYKGKKIIVAIPCYNEEKAIKKVINAFKMELPSAEIIVFDNNSKDKTVEIALKEGVKVIHEKRQGKGWVVRSVFEKLAADIYVIIDGDDTYPVDKVHKLIGPVLKGEADMVVGSRLDQFEDKAFKKINHFGNWLITKTLNLIFRTNYRDVLSGYRVFNKEFAKNIPLITRGFEIETEISLQALEHGYIIKEIPIQYRKRLEGSYSKLSPFKDGYRIMVTILMLLRDHQPQQLFSLIFVFLSTVSAALICYAYTLKNLLNGYLIAGIISLIIAFLFFVTGLILSAINTRFREVNAILKKDVYYSTLNKEDTKHA